MAITALGSVTGAEKPDPKAAERPSAGAEDRPGFDLGGAGQEGGGAVGASPPGSTIIPGGPASPAPVGADTGRSGGEAGLAGSAPRSPGGPLGGSREGEVMQPTPGGLRPPQTEGGDRSDSQGSDTDAT